MMRLEELVKGVVVEGVVPDGPVTVVDVEWAGPDAVELTYRLSSGRMGNALLFRSSEPELRAFDGVAGWTFSEDGGTFRLAAEAYRLKMAYLFDPLLAVHTSLVEALPHQISAVYERMLPRQPLRFLLADGPGAGKTIMAGLLMTAARRAASGRVPRRRRR